MAIQTRQDEQPSKPADGKEPAKRSGVEITKEASVYLRGSIQEVLQGTADHFEEGDKNLLKFHGTYQQEDRDARKNRNKNGLGKQHMFMVRCKIPGGRLTAAQYLAVDELSGRYANGTLRFTSRQGIQLHGVLKNNLKEAIAGINDCLLTTLGACGDVERNIMACPAPHNHNPIRSQLQATAAELAAHLAPRTTVYHEIWLNGKSVRAISPSKKGTGPLPPLESPLENEGLERSSPLFQPAAKPTEEAEPLYGKTYLPRKFKTGLALPEDNCIDVYAQDLGLLAVVENQGILGYNMLVGGGMGMTHGNASTFPFLAKPICFVPAESVVQSAEAVIKLFRDHGNRADRKHARIKYLVHDWGVTRFRQVLAEYLGSEPETPRAVEVNGLDLHLGWRPQGDGRWFYGISIENGRVKDEATLRLRTGLRTLISQLQPEVRLTPMQDVLLCNLPATARTLIESLLTEHGIPLPESLSSVQTNSMACPAMPTCGLALTESERVLPGIIDELESEISRLGLANERITVRMTGCPNGCARPYQSDIGIVGRSGDKYTIFVGGHYLGHRLNFELRDLVPRSQIVMTLRPLLAQYKTGRRGGESFGDFCQRLGKAKLDEIAPEMHSL